MILMQLSANTGPEECCLAVRRALALLLQECMNANVHAELLAQQAGDREGNLRSVLLALEGEAALTVAQRWRGSVLWVCASPYRPGHKRKNWFLGAEVFEAEASPDGSPLRDSDLCFETMRASGPGGQHVNKTDSAVRATHLPSGTSVKVQTERSQQANKRLARALLAHKLAAAAKEALEAAKSLRWSQHNEVERGNPRRVFKGSAFTEVPRPQARSAPGHGPPDGGRRPARAQIAPPS